MGWSINRITPNEPELLDEYFLAFGKALYLSSAFESKCRWVLRIAKLVHHYKLTDEASAAWALAEAMKDDRLGNTIKALMDFPSFTADHIKVLICAKNARNFIAHESAEIGLVSSAKARTIHSQMAKLRVEVKALASGDNLVSKWVYEIEEKKAAPRVIQEEYPGKVEKWVFNDECDA